MQWTAEESNLQLTQLVMILTRGNRRPDATRRFG